MVESFITNISIRGAFNQHIADLDAHTYNEWQTLRIGQYNLLHSSIDPPLVGTPTANTLVTYPIIIARDITLDRIAIEITTAVAGNNVRIGLYNNSTNCYPSTLLLDSGNIDCTAIGIKEVVISQPLLKGIYWKTYLSQSGSIACRRISIQPSIIGIDNTNFSLLGGGFYHAQAFGALPATFPTAAPSLFNLFPVIPLRILTLD